jgi:diguanylate cyclase (GGDEF)-like protein
LVVAPIILLGGLGYIALRDRTEEAVQDQVNTLLDQVALYLDAKLRAVQADTRVLASSDLVERYVLSADELDRYELFQPSLLKMFGEQQQVNPDYFEIRILFPDGYEDLRATAQPVPNLSEEEGGSAYFQALSAAQADTFSTFLSSPDNGWPVLLVSKRLRLKDRSVDPLATKAKVRGYLIITARLATLERQVRTNRIGADGILFFTDGQGQILLHPDPLRLGAQLPAPLFSGLLTSTDDARLKPLYGGSEGLLWQARKLHEDLYAIVSFPEQELAAAGRRLGLTVLAISILTLVVTAVSLFLLLERTVNAPIQRLRKAAREIGKGNLDPTVAPGGAREIVELTRSFQAMGQDLRNSDERIRFLAFHDPITGLPNRKMFMEYVDRALEQTNIRGATIAVLLLNLDDFRQINESLGHAAGDELLKAFAARLSRNLHSEAFSAAVGPGKASDLVAHMGGDEFAVLLTDISSALDAGIFSRRLLEDLARPCELKATKVTVSASLAITIFLDDGQDAATLLRNAYIAMYRAKDRGKNNFQYYSEPLNARVAAHFEMERRLRDDLARERLRLFFQPVVNREGKRTVALEALLHWDDPDLQVIPPEKLAEIAERSDLIYAIGAWVLERACRWGASWQTRGLPEVSLWVNIFERQVNRGDLNETVQNILKATGLQAHLLNLQITESCVLAAKERAIDLLAGVRASGVRISIDKVGTGYASLNYLRRLPIDSLKIDRSFLEQAATGTQESVIIDAILTMGHRLGLKVVAKGVETTEQLRFLEDRACDLFQGSLFGHPVPAEEVPRLLSQTEAVEADTRHTVPETRRPTASPASQPKRRQA